MQSLKICVPSRTSGDEVGFLVPSFEPFKDIDVLEKMC